MKSEFFNQFVRLTCSINADVNVSMVIYPRRNLYLLADNCFSLIRGRKRMYYVDFHDLRYSNKYQNIWKNLEKCNGVL